MTCLLLPTVALALVLTNGHARAEAQPTAPPETRAQVELRFLERAPVIDDFAGMVPPKDLEGQLSAVKDFVERMPADGAPAMRRTDVYLGRDERHLYAAFVCFTEPADTLRAHLSARDRIDGEDAVFLELDTFRDERRAYVFRSNPVGIESDGVWIEGRGLDRSFDLPWESTGVVTDRGFVVLMTIPFESLRFPPGESQRWGALLGREIPHLGEQSYWPRYSTRAEGRLDQMAVLEVASAVPQGRLWRLLPYATVRASQALDLRDPAAPLFVEERAQPVVGADAKLVLRESVVVDVTANPDFSEVEPDDPILTANSLYEVRRNEKRPFFLENANYFDTPITAFYSRRVVRPTMGARVTGKLGAFDLGAIAIDDASPGEQLAPPLEPSVARSWGGVFRVSRDVYRQSSLGAVYVLREQGGGYDHVGGIDGRLKLSDNWVTAFQLLGSRVEDPARRLDGVGVNVSLRERGAHTSYDLTYNDRSPSFRLPLGFAPQVEYRHAKQIAEYQFRPNGDLVASWGPRSMLAGLWGYDGVLLSGVSYYGLSCDLAHGTHLEASFEHGGERLRPKDLPGLSATVYTRFFDAGLVAGGEVSHFATYFGTASWGLFPNRQPAAGQLPESERLFQGSLGLTLRPTRHLSAEASWQFERMWDDEDGSDVYSADALWARVTYQFTPRLSAKSVFLLSRVSGNPTHSSLKTSRSLGGLVLLTYQYRLGTELSLGYRGDWLHPDPRLGYTPSFVETAEYLNAERIFFVKVSYLLGS